MDCREVEIRLVHSLDGDLAGGLSEHLAECESCRTFYRELVADRDALQRLGAEPLPEEAVRELQRRVMRQIPGKRGKLWWVPVVAAAAVLLAVALWPIPETPAPAVAVMPAKPPAIAWQRSNPQPATAPQPLLRRHRQKEQLPERTLFVKLETPDPNVIIYWMVESKGELE